MAGPRDTEWAHIRVIGDRGRASSYLPDARKVLGFVKQEAQRTGLTVYSKRVVLADGTVLIGEIHGQMPRITIIVGGEQASANEVRYPEDFVVIARNDDLPDSIDTDHPQQILRPDGKDPAQWTTLFWDSDIPGYDDFAKRKGTYRFKSGVELFPDGATYSGNIDWRSEKNVRVSWQGPTLRYWYDRWRQPSAQYGKHVFLLGQILLDIDQYCTDSAVSFDERYVLGACLIGNKLTVMQADIEEQSEIYTAPPTARKRDGICSDPYPTSPVKLKLIQYTVYEETSQAVDRFKIQDNSHEVLWDDELSGFVNPWFFNRTGTVCETFSMPAITQAVHYRWDEDLPHVANTYDMPSPSSYNLALTIENDMSVTENSNEISVSPASELQEGPIAADYDEEGNRLELWLTIEVTHNEGERPVDWEDEDYLYYFFRDIDRMTFQIRRNGVLDSEVVLWAPTAPVSVGARVGLYERCLGIDIRYKSFFNWKSDSTVAPGNDVTINFRHKSYHKNGTALLPVFQTVEANGVGFFNNASCVAEFAYRSGVSELPILFYLFGVVIVSGSINKLFGVSITPITSYDTAFMPSSRWFTEPEIYGIVGEYDETGANPFITYYFSDRFSDSMFCNKSDRLGYKTSAGYAVNTPIVMYSGISFYYDVGIIKQNQFHYVTGNSLNTLTGVPDTSEDEKARFHPLWIMGVPPK